MRFKLISLIFFSKQACVNSSDHFKRPKIKSKYGPNDLLNYLMDFLISIFISSGFKSLTIDKQTRNAYVCCTLIIALQVMCNYFSKLFIWNLIHHIVWNSVTDRDCYFRFDKHSVFTQRATNELLIVDIHRGFFQFINLYR